MKFKNIPAALLFFCFSAAVFAQPYSHGPRDVGEEVLDELLIGKKTVVAKVSSGGCTGKGSYEVDVKKVDGITERAPHYILTIKRIRIDECKAIVEDGPVISWDLEKDLGLTGNYTVSVKNMVYVVPPPYETGDAENSMLSAVRKHVEITGSESGETPPEGGSGRRKL